MQRSPEEFVLNVVILILKGDRVSKLDFIINDKPYIIPKVVRNRKPLPGFKFALGDRVRCISSNNHMGWYIMDENTHVQIGEVLTIDNCAKSDVNGEPIYGFVEDKIQVEAHWCNVEANFELVKD